MLFLSESDVQQLFPMPAAIEQMRLAFEAICAGATINHPRRRIILPTGSVLHSMAGSYPGPPLACFVTKNYTHNLKHGGLHQMIVMLYSAETGKPLAFIEANAMSLIRTGAATGYAARMLADPAAKTVGLIGSGYQAQSQVEAIRAVRPIEEVRVWSRKAENAQRFAEANGCTAVASAEAAVRDASIIITATNAKDPVLESSWIAPGTFVAAMGSNVASRRELPAELVLNAGLIAVDNFEQAQVEAGDLLLAAPDRSIRDWPNVRELQDVEAGYDASRITIFESLGIGVEDAAAASFVYDAALQQGLGREL